MALQPLGAAAERRHRTLAHIISRESGDDSQTATALLRTGRSTRRLRRGRGTRGRSADTTARTRRLRNIATRGQVGTGERSEKIRTYNFPQSRITDHRINFTTHRLHDVLEGDPGEILDQVISFYNAEKLKEATTVS